MSDYVCESRMEMGAVAAGIRTYNDKAAVCADVCASVQDVRLINPGWLLLFQFHC